MADTVSIIIYSFIFIFAIFGFIGFIVNSLQVVLMFCKREKKTVFDMTLISLSLSNAASAACFGAFGTLLTYHHTLNLYWPVEVFITYWHLRSVSDYCIMISLFHIIFIAMQRFVAVTFPLRFKAFITKKITLVVLILIWLVSGMMMLVEYFVIKYAKRKIAMAYLIFSCGLSLAVLYCFVFYKVVKQRRAMQNVTSHVANTSHSYKLLFNSIGVTVVFILLTFPYAAIVLGKSYTYYNLFASFLAIKTAFDPMIYFFINRCHRCRCTRVARNVEPIPGTHGNANIATRDVNFVNETVL